MHEESRKRIQHTDLAFPRIRGKDRIVSAKRARRILFLCDLSCLFVAIPSQWLIVSRTHQKQRTRLALRVVANRVLNWGSKPARSGTASSDLGGADGGNRRVPAASRRSDELSRTSPVNRHRALPLGSRRLLLPGDVKQAVSRDGLGSPYAGDSLLRFTCDKLYDALRGQKQLEAVDCRPKTHVVDRD